LPRRFVPWWLTGNRGTNLSEEILRKGWAVVYESAGGVFPHPEKKEGYLKLMSEAQYATISTFHIHCSSGVPYMVKRKAKVGMWKHGTSLETPGQYKKRTKQGVPPETTDSASEESEEESWLQRKFKNVFGRH
jgi:hypothetical protein